MPAFMAAAGTSLKNSKRIRRRQSRFNTSGDFIVGDLHDIAYWSQWRLAIRGVCTGFEAIVHGGTDGWSREQLDLSISRQQALSGEVRDLETQLGRHIHVNVNLEEALRDNTEALAKAELARVTAAAAATGLKAQMLRDKETASASARELERKLSLSTIAHQGAEASLRQAEIARLQAEEMCAKLLREAAGLKARISDATSAMAIALEDSRAERERGEALQADLAVLRDKYSALKRRFVDAGRKVEVVRAERDALRQERAVLEDKLADVEKFQTSKRGQALDRMEQDLASERLARVELEADRDDLQSQLAAALQATGRT